MCYDIPQKELCLNSGMKFENSIVPPHMLHSFYEAKEKRGRVSLVRH